MSAPPPVTTTLTQPTSLSKVWGKKRKKPVFNRFVIVVRSYRYPVAVAVVINFELKKLFTYRKKFSFSAPATGPDTGCDDLELETSSEQLDDDFRGSASGDRQEKKGA